MDSKPTLGTPKGGRTSAIGVEEYANRRFGTVSTFLGLSAW